jgi:uncharacterized transporter YbjL
MMAALFAIASYLTFIFATAFPVFAIAQVLLAGAIAFQSGSDNSLLYDSLVVAGRENEYAAHEAKAQQYNMLSLAISVLIGGALGTINLKLAYTAALAAAIVTLLVCYRFSEPDRVDSSETHSFLPQLHAAAGALKQPIGLSMFGGALGARSSEALRTRFGTRAVLIAGPAIQCLIIAVMAILLHPAILLIIVFRNFSMAMTHAPMHATIAPRIQSAQRATYLSLQSLAGRLAFSVMLFVIAGNAAQTLTWPALSSIFKTSVALGVIALLVLAATSKPVTEQNA